MAGYKVGDKVEYHPIGGAAENVASSTGEIVNITGSGSDQRFAIKNDNTGKVTHYQGMSITKKI